MCLFVRAIVDDDAVATPAQPVDNCEPLAIPALASALEIDERVLTLPADDEVDVVAVERHRRIQRREIAAPNDRQLQCAARNERDLDRTRSAARPSRSHRRQRIGVLARHRKRRSAAVDVPVDQCRVAVVLERRGDRHDRQGIVRGAEPLSWD